MCLECCGKISSLYASLWSGPEGSPVTLSFLRGPGDRGDVNVRRASKLTRDQHIPLGGSPLAQGPAGGPPVHLAPRRELPYPTHGWIVVWGGISMTKLVLALSAVLVLTMAGCR